MKSDLEHTSTMLGSQNMKSSQRMVSVVEPYELPEGWKWCRLGDVCRTFSDGDWIESKDQSTEGIRLIQTGNIGKGTFRDKDDKCRYISENTFERLNCTEIFAGDILISRLPEPVGRACIIPQLKDRMITAVDCAIVRLFEGAVEKKWFCFYTQSHVYDGLVKTSCTGTTRLRISRKNLGEIPFPLPPTLAEQQRIVNRIESMFAKLDEAKEKAQNVVDGFETRKAAILHKAFTGELKIENEKLKEEDWEETTLGKCCKLGSGGTPSKSHPEYYENGDIPWLKTGEIDWNDIYDAEEKITDDGVANSSAKMFPAESVVVAMYGMGVTRGRAAIIKKPMTTNQAVCVLQPKEKLYNKFLFYYFMCNYHKIREQSVGGNQLNLSGKIIGNFPIKLPPFIFQLSIVNFLDIIIEKENKAKQAAEAVLEQIDLLKESILA